MILTGHLTSQLMGDLTSECLPCHHLAGELTGVCLLCQVVELGIPKVGHVPLLPPFNFAHTILLPPVDMPQTLGSL